MRYPDIEHHGAKDGVTGSCHLLRMDAAHCLLVDCGLFQGNDASIPDEPGADRLAIEFPLDTIKALVATLAHIDHVGGIPYLLAAGFEGPILCSEPSAKLLPIVLEAAFKFGFSRDQVQIDKYIQLVEWRIMTLPYQQWFTLADISGLLARIRLQRARHILGSAYVEIDLSPQTGETKRVVFSGDLGAPHAPFLMPPEAPECTDVLVMESTYGGRLHEDRSNRRLRLEAVIEQALENQGTVLIPAFSIGRTQELLYELEDMIHSKLNDSSASVGASLLANRIAAPSTDPWNKEARERIQSGRRQLAFQQLITVDSHSEHQHIVNHLVQTARPAIVIAGGGMCSGGRIVNYIKAMLGDKCTTSRLLATKPKPHQGTPSKPMGRPAAILISMASALMFVQALPASVAIQLMRIIED